MDAIGSNQYKRRDAKHLQAVVIIIDTQQGTIVLQSITQVLLLSIALAILVSIYVHSTSSRASECNE